MGDIKQVGSKAVTAATGDAAYVNVTGDIMTGELEVDVAGTVATFNRTSTDGKVLVLKKDGSNVADFGTKGGDLYLGTFDTGIRFNDANNQMLPFDPNGEANIDATIDLGSTGARFKDLYLSGGAYLGGTASNNLLSAMDRQSFTPTFTNFTIGNGSVWGYYQTINDVCCVSCGFVMGSTSTVDGAFSISALPETSSNNGTNVRYQLQAMAVTAGNILGGYAYIGNNSSSTSFIKRMSDDAAMSTTAPFTWASTDAFTITGSYPIN